jgi:hypothetical protein
MWSFQRPDHVTMAYGEPADRTGYGSGSMLVRYNQKPISVMVGDDIPVSFGTITIETTRLAPRNSRRPRSRETLAGRRSLPAEPCARWESWRRPDAAFLPAPSFATVQTTNPCDPTAPCQPPGRGRGDLKARQIVLITGSDSMVTCLAWQSHRPPNGMH